MKKRGKKRAGTVVLIACILAGLALMLYPGFSNYWNSVYSTHTIAVYSEKTAELTEDEYKDIWEAACNYNAGLRSIGESSTIDGAEKYSYENLLNIDGNGVMGYIEIPKIKVTLPISHGISDEVLEKGVGHVEWSSLPVGGESTHCVLSGHRGLPNAKLFTNLDKLEKGDCFMLCVLNEVLTYEVDQILIVKPDETEALSITAGMDYCTLVTCTPYGINTHRLLVRGHRVPNIDAIHVTSEAVQIETLMVALFLAIPVMIVMFAVMFALDRRRNNLTMEVNDDDRN